MKSIKKKFLHSPLLLSFQVGRSQGAKSEKGDQDWLIDYPETVSLQKLLSRALCTCIGVLWSFICFRADILKTPEMALEVERRFKCSPVTAWSNEAHGVGLWNIQRALLYSIISAGTKLNCETRNLFIKALSFLSRPCNCTLNACPGMFGRLGLPSHLAQTSNRGRRREPQRSFWLNCSPWSDSLLPVCAIRQEADCHL